MRDKLPRGWAKCHVQDCFYSVGGGTPNKGVPAYWGGEIPWFSSGDIKTDRVISSSESITRLGLESSSANLCRAGSVLVVVRSGILKHTLPVAVLGREAAINQDIKCFDSGNDQLNEWLAFGLRAATKEILALNREGTTVQSVQYNTLKGFELPLPPAAEQSRIVAKLEKLLPRIEECQERISKLPVFLKRFRQSVLSAACSGRLTNDWRKSGSHANRLPSDWKQVSLHELLPSGGIFDGPFGSNLKTSDYTGSGVRVIRLENIGQLRFINERKTYISRAKYQTLKKHTVAEDDIILASFIDGDIRVCLLPALETAAIAKADCFCIRPKPELIDTTYLTYQLASWESYKALIEDVHGATRPRINTTQLKRLRVRVCPLAEQKEIVRRVSGLFALADAIEGRYMEVQRRVDHLSQSILAKAFQGELVPTEAELAEADGRLFESAEELLARIEHSNGTGTNKESRRSNRTKRAAV